MTPLSQGQAEPTELGCVKHGLAHPCEQCSKEVAAINDMANSFFSHIAHGDEDHRAWLKRETFAWFNGRARLYASRLAASSAAPTDLHIAEPVAWLQIGLGPMHEGERLVRLTKPKIWDTGWWRFEPLFTHGPRPTEDGESNG